jgi:hypothetical protein
VIAIYGIAPVDVKLVDPQQPGWHESEPLHARPFCWRIASIQRITIAMGVTGDPSDNDEARALAGLAAVGLEALRP